MSRRVLVTGATGFVGANVARLLLERGCQVRVLVRPSADTRNLPAALDAERVIGDLRDLESLQKAVHGCDEVYHVAADYRFWTLHPEEVYQSNVRGTDNLMKTCLKQGVGKVVYTSTVGTIGLSQQPKPCDENTPLDPGQMTGHYKQSKWQAEQLVVDYARRGLPVVIVNPSAPIGPWDRKPTPTGKVIVDFCNGKMPAYVQTGLNFVHVRDVAEGHLLAAEKGRIGERYILGNSNLTMIEFLRLLSRVTGRPAPKMRIPYALAWSAGWISTCYADLVSKKEPAVPLEAVKMSRRFMFFSPAKAIAELGLPQTPVETAAKDAVEWFAENGCLTNTFNFIKSAV